MPWCSRCWARPARRILTAHLVEYLLLAVISALFAVGLGAFAAWIAVTEIMKIPFSFSLEAVLMALGVAIGLVLLFGAFGTWSVLRAKPAQALQDGIKTWRAARESERLRWPYVSIPQY